MKNIAAHICVSILLLLLSLPADAQSNNGKAYILGTTTHNGETIAHIKLPPVYIFTPLNFRNKREKRRFDRLVYDVKKTLPLATEIRKIIIETYETLQILPDEKAKKRHIDMLEKELKDTYTPKMKRLSLRQGKLLIKLVDRQCVAVRCKPEKELRPGWRGQPYGACGDRGVVGESVRNYLIFSSIAFFVNEGLRK